MSDFLDINGVPISVANDTPVSAAPVDIGEQTNAVDGTLVRSRIALKQKYTFTTPPLSASDSLAWKALINGLGHHWSFDSTVYSGKGLGPTAASSGYVQSGSGGLYVGMLQVDTNAQGGFYQVSPSGMDAVAGANGWTVMLWIRAQDGATWNHYLFQGSGNSIINIYKNGVSASSDADTNCINFGQMTSNLLKFSGYGFVINANAVIPSWIASHTYAANTLGQPTSGHYNGRFYKVTAGGGGNSGTVEPTWPTVLGNTVVDGALTWTDQGPSSLYIDDLVVLPFKVPNSWVSSLYTFAATQAYPDQPNLYVSGLYPLQANLMLGSVGQTKLIQAFLNGVFTQNLQTVEFTLEEA